MTVVPVSDKQAGRAAFWDPICVDQEVGDTWWRALAKPGLRLTQIPSLPFGGAAAELTLFSDKGRTLHVSVFRGFAGIKLVRGSCVQRQEHPNSAVALCLHRQDPIPDTIYAFALLL